MVWVLTNFVFFEIPFVDPLVGEVRTLCSVRETPNTTPNMPPKTRTHSMNSVVVVTHTTDMDKVSTARKTPTMNP